jgi:hypothetical protein
MIPAPIIEFHVSRNAAMTVGIGWRYFGLQQDGEPETPSFLICAIWAFF